MKVGVPTEIKHNEARVGLTPAGARQLIAAGAQVLLQSGAGADCSFTDEMYAAAGAVIVTDAEAVYAKGDLIVKVKEPQPSEVAMLRKGQLLFTYLHLAAYPGITRGLQRSGATAIAYETVQNPDGSLPLLAPMSEIAGRMAAQVSARFLERPQGGRGVLLGGAPGVSPARTVVLGAGRAGVACAVALAGLGADVVVVDKDIDKLRALESRDNGRITTRMADLATVEELTLRADVVVGAVLVAGAAAPRLITEDLVKRMQPGSLLVDISIDQGGTFETSRETTHKEPVFTLHGVNHYAVGNIPGAVPYTATRALTNVTLPYIVALLDGVDAATKRLPSLMSGLNIRDGEITNPAVASAVMSAFTH
jgi:alanine dehydrogenase